MPRRRGSFLARAPRGRDARTMRGRPALPWFFATSLAVAASAGCRSTPSEAAEPRASAWPEEGMDPGEPVVDADRDPAEPMIAAEPARPRPQHTIFRDEIQRATRPGPAYLLRQLGPEPFRHQGHFVGWEITQLFPDDPQLCAAPCDLALGDVILGVNGHRLQTPQDLSDALQALPQWSHLTVQSLRDGRRREVTYAIVDDVG